MFGTTDARKGGTGLRGAWRSLAVAVACMPLAACGQGFNDRSASQSVVRIQHVFAPAKAGGRRELLGVHGSGVVITSTGHVLTTNDVAMVKSRAPRGWVWRRLVVLDRSWSKSDWRDAKIVWSSPALNLAVLQVPGLSRPPAVLSAAASEDEIREGAMVVGVGFGGVEDSAAMRAGLKPSIATGSVGKLTIGRANTREANRRIVQHSVILRAGQAGGPLMDTCNRVVAINGIPIPGRFRVAKGPAGEYVTYDSAVTVGVVSTHMSGFLRALNTDPKLKGLDVTRRAGGCTPPSTLPTQMYAAVGVLALLALVSMLLALVRKRGAGEVLQAVESYSRIIRRGGGRVADVGAPAGSGTPVGADSGALWTLEGADPDRTPIRLLFTERDLETTSDGEASGIIIGRSHALAGRVINHESISRRHARIVLAEPGIGIEDLASTHGTKVDGEKLQPYVVTRLHPGVTIMLGQVKLELLK